MRVSIVIIVVVVIVISTRVFAIDTYRGGSGGGCSADRTARVLDHWRVSKQVGRMVGYQGMGSSVGRGIQMIGGEHGEAWRWQEGGWNQGHPTEVETEG